MERLTILEKAKIIRGLRDFKGSVSLGDIMVMLYFIDSLSIKKQFK